MRDHRLAILAPDIEDKAVFLEADVERIRSALVADRRKRVFLDQIVDRDLAFMVDVRAGAADRFLVERHRDEPVVIGCLRGRHRRLRRMATERAWASSPSASPSAMAEG